MVEQVVGLHQHADMASAQTSPCCFGPPRQALSHDVHMTAIGLVQTGEAGEERRLATPGRADQGDHLAGVELHIDASQRRRLIVAHVEEPIQLVAAEHAHVTANGKSSTSAATDPHCRRRVARTDRA